MLSAKYLEALGVRCRVFFLAHAQAEARNIFASIDRTSEPQICSHGPNHKGSIRPVKFPN